MITVKNREQLVKNGQTELDKKARKLAIRCLESAVNSVDPYRIVRSRVRFRNSVLNVDQHVFDLGKFRNVYVVGGGKASGSMAVALEKILDNYITGGLVNVPKGDMNRTKIIRLHEASHPIPDESGVAGTRRMLRIAEEADEDDLVICLISGGGSSLMPLPRGKISIMDKRKLTDGLLRSGATINEINTVRKHVSGFKGGWLAKKAYPATILNLILSDVVGDPLDFIASGPTVPDSTTFNDAVRVLEKYHLWNTASPSVRKVLTDGQKGLIPDTPKAEDDAFKKTHTVIVGNNRSASLAACERLRIAGLNALLLTAALEGEAREAGIILAAVAREVSTSENPARRPAGIVAGGETTVTVTGKGLGGRNQEISLAASSKLSGLKGVVVASLATDGVDGPTDAAGAIADGETLTRAAELGLTPEQFLSENDSYHFFEELGDLMFTGPTGTNVNDVSVIIVL
jgi:glycerate-2-kinase